METHVKVLAILQIVLGALGLCAALIILLVFGGIAGIVGSAAPDTDARVAVPILGLIGGFVILVIVVLSLPGLIAGYGLLQYAEWARILTIVLSVLHLLNFPLGTALGVYGLWILLSPQTLPLFQRTRT